MLDRQVVLMYPISIISRSSTIKRIIKRLLFHSDQEGIIWLS